MMQTHTLSVCRGFLSRRFIAMLLLQLVPAGAVVAANSRGYRGEGNEHWVATWSTALHQPDLAVPGLANNGFNDQTLRQILHTSIGGRLVRVQLSTFGASGLVLGAAHIALSAGGSAVVPGSDRALTFDGESSITIPPGAPVVSDPVELAVPELGDLTVTFFVPGVTGPATWHFDARQTSYVSPPGDFTESAVMPLDALTPTTPSWFWLAGVDVIAPEHSGAIAALHDGLGTNGLARFDRDVLSQSGLSHVIVFFGDSDIGAGWPGGSNPDQEVTLDQIIQSYRQLIERAHARGVKIYGATLTPFQGFVIPGRH